jgi:hypothetical protein
MRLAQFVFLCFSQFHVAQAIALLSPSVSSTTLAISLGVSRWGYRAFWNHSGLVGFVATMFGAIESRWHDRKPPIGHR